MSANYVDPAARQRAYEPAIFGDRGQAHTHRRVSWPAIFGGVVLVVALQVLLSLLGTGIGFSTVNANAGTTPDASSFGTGGVVWWAVTSIIALGIGGYVSAWLAGIENRMDGVLHGLIAWAMATLLTVGLLTSAVSGLISGGASALGGVVSATGSGIKEAAKPVAQAAGLSPDVVQDQAHAYLKPTNTDPATMSPQDAQKEVATNLVTYAKGGPDAPIAKEKVINIMAAQQHVSHDQAAKQFDDTQQKLEQAKAQAIQAAKNAADASASAASKASSGAFVLSMIGALAAAVGGAFAMQRRELRA